MQFNGKRLIDQRAKYIRRYCSRPFRIKRKTSPVRPTARSEDEDSRCYEFERLFEDAQTEDDQIGAGRVGIVDSDIGR